MTTRKQFVKKATEKLEDPLGYLEDADYALMKQLGIRSHYWPNTGNKGVEHDQRPCPSWCWVGQSPTYGHGNSPTTPMTAHHDMEACIYVPLTLYRGATEDANGDVSVTTAATLEPRLEQVGQGGPTLRFALRGYDREGKSTYQHEILKLTVEDTKDLMTALAYLVQLAEEG